MYKIARYLTKTEREKAVSVEYYPIGYEEGAPLRCLVQGHRYCPLGLATNDVGGSQLPESWALSELLVRVGRVEEAQGTKVKKAAKRFILDWDSGKIKDLKKAMGVK